MYALLRKSPSPGVTSRFGILVTGQNVGMQKRQIGQTENPALPGNGGLLSPLLARAELVIMHRSQRLHSAAPVKHPAQVRCFA
jgi:hypothetical protein